MLGFKLHYQIEPIGFADEYRVRGKENSVSGVWAVRFTVAPFAKVKESRFGSDVIPVVATKLSFLLVLFSINLCLSTDHSWRFQCTMRFPISYLLLEPPWISGIWPRQVAFPMFTGQ